jgi:hypothetical protein
MKLKFWKICFFILAFLSFGAALYFFLKTKMVRNTDQITFLSSSELQAVLDEDADQYYKTFNKVDLKLRKSKNLKEYLARISNSGSEGAEESKEKIMDCIQRINRKLEDVIGGGEEKVINGIDLRKFLDMPWRIGFTGNTLYEHGLPHTRDGVIIINNRDVEKRNISQMCRLLIHEKVHVYQKIFKTEFAQYLERTYEKTPKGKNNEIPANPDTDRFVYTDKTTGQILQGKYRDNPSHFRDIDFTDDDHTKEHPNELVAYTLEDLYE